MQNTGVAFASEIDEMPNSPEAEAAILGSIFDNNALMTDALDLLTAEDFYLPSNRKVFLAMRALAKRGEQITQILACEEIKKTEPPFVDIGSIL